MNHKTRYVQRSAAILLTRQPILLTRQPILLTQQPIVLTQQPIGSHWHAHGVMSALAFVLSILVASQPAVVPPSKESPLTRARALSPPIPAATSDAAFEGADFFETHGALLRAAWQEHGLADDSLSSFRRTTTEPRAMLRQLNRFRFLGWRTLPLAPNVIHRSLKRLLVSCVRA